MNFFDTSLSTSKRGLISLSIILMLSGCANYIGINSNKKIATPEQFATQNTIPSENGQWPDMDWVKQFGDQQLKEIISEALKNNPSIAEAQARLRKATAFTEMARSSLFPQIGANYNNTRGIYSETAAFPPPLGGTWYSENTIFAKFSFDLDLWGKNKQRLLAAASTARAAEAETQQVKIALTASITHAYIQLAELEKNLSIAEQEAKIRQNIYQINKAQVNAGLANHLTTQTSQAQIANQKATIEHYQSQINQVRYQLAALMGKGPDQGLAIRPPKLRTLKNIRLPDEIPANLIARRPDLTAAKWQVEANLHNIKAAKAEFFPNINLVANYGFDSFGWERFLHNASRQIQIGPAISLPIFDGGALRAQLRTRYAELEENIAIYNKTLINALNEVATQVASIRSIDQQILAMSEAFINTQRNEQLINQRYQVGLAPYLSVLNAKSAVLTSEQALMQLEMMRRNLQVNLITALGGGFYQQPITPSNTPSHNTTASF